MADPSGTAATCAIAGFTFWIPFLGQVALAICGGTIVILGGIVLISGLTVVANNILWKTADGPSRLNEEVRRGQAPPSVTGAHNPHVRGGKPHVHFRDGYARNQDGTRHHGRERPLTKREREWLSKHGWK
jgi:hypothetical protein